MDVRSIEFDWNRARAFWVTAKAGSFSAAARALKQSQPTIGRQVKALEEELGVTLFERVGHDLVLTPTGAEIAEEIGAMGEAATRASFIAAGQSRSVDGVVRLAASQAVSAHLLPKVVERLRRAHPRLEVELVVSNQSSDLRRREADIAVRHYRPEGEDFIAKRIKEASSAFLYAAPTYLRKIGSPKTPSELGERAEVLGFDDAPRLLSALRHGGLPFSDSATPIRTEDHLVQWELCKRGMGLCIMMEEVGDQERKVRRALDAAAPVVTLPIWLVSHRELRTSRKYRVVFDAVADHLASL